MIIKTYVGGVLRTNTYLVYQKEGTEAVIIDPFRRFAEIKQYCETAGVQVIAVLLTHGHFDHTGEAGLWQKEGAKIYIHTLDADKLYSDKNLAHLLNASAPACRADVLLTGGEMLDLAGIGFQVLHTPGHAAGAVCYVAEDVIFSGDTLFSGDYGRVDFPDGSFEDIKHSIRKLFALPGNYRVYPGHEEATTLEKERWTNSILESL